MERGEGISGHSDDPFTVSAPQFLCSSVPSFEQSGLRGHMNSRFHPHSGLGLVRRTPLVYVAPRESPRMRTR